jgi:Tol biopolymer transport system component
VAGSGRLHRATRRLKPASGDARRPARGLYLLPSDGRTPSWSPDRSKLAFAVENPRATGRCTPPPPMERMRPADRWRSPAWSPDGMRIAFDQFVDAGGREQVFPMGISTDRAFPVPC